MVCFFCFRSGIQRHDMPIYCNVQVVTTSPGNARQVSASDKSPTRLFLPLIPVPQYTQTTTRPGYDHIDRSSTLNSTDIRGTSYELTSPTPNASHPPTHEPAQKLNPQPSLGSGKSKTVVSAADSSVAKLEQSSHSQASNRDLEAARATDESVHIPDTTTHASTYQSGPPVAPPMFSRRPTTTPVLLPEYRYCSRCQIVKPSRTHHCRACGTVSYVYRPLRVRHSDPVSSVF